MSDNNDNLLELLSKMARIGINLVLLVKRLEQFNKELKEVEEEFNRNHISKGNGNSDD